VPELLHHRTARHELADRLIVEYAGAVPPGQVLACVLRADRVLASYPPNDQARLALCEELVRHRLVEHNARTGRALAAHAS